LGLSDNNGEVYGTGHGTNLEKVAITAIIHRSAVDAILKK